MKSKKRRYAAKTREYNIEEGMEGVGLGSRGKKWAGLVRLIAPELCRKNKLSCRRRAELGWAEQGTGSGKGEAGSICTSTGRAHGFTSRVLAHLLRSLGRGCLLFGGVAR